MSEISETIAAVIDLGFSPLLKNAGFRKNDRHFYQSESNVIQVVTIQSNRWNTAESGSFRVNFGIHFSEVAKALRGIDRMPKIPKEHYCILRGMFSVPDLWWTVDRNSDVKAVGEKLDLYWRDVVWPWLEKNKSLAEAAVTLERQGHLAGPWAAAAARLVLEERDEATRLVKVCIANVESSTDFSAPVNAKIAAEHLQKIREWAAEHELTI